MQLFSIQVGLKIDFKLFSSSGVSIRELHAILTEFKILQYRGNRSANLFLVMFRYSELIQQESIQCVIPFFFFINMMTI